MIYSSLFLSHTDLQNKESMMMRQFMVISNTSSWVPWATLERDGNHTGTQTHFSELPTNKSLLRNDILHAA